MPSLGSVIAADLPGTIVRPPIPSVRISLTPEQSSVASRVTVTADLYHPLSPAMPAMLRTVVAGATASLMVTTTVSVAVPPLLSSTVKVIVYVPKGRVTTGRTPLALPPFHAQVYASALPSGSEDAEPSRVTLVPLVPPHAAVWSGPASATGGRLRAAHMPTPPSL